MPFYSRYIIVRPLPRQLVYQNGALELEVVSRGDGSRGWEFRAKKMISPPTYCTIAYSPYGKWALDRLMRGEGFVLGDDTPAGKIMERLTHEGYAERNNATSRDLQ